MTKKAMIAMSGGVDSSVAAYLTAQAGYACLGVTMKLYEETSPGERTCCTAEDAMDARSVAVRVGFPFYVFNMVAEFRRQVIEPFVAEYEAGRTPNPCLECNRCLKFGSLLEKAHMLDCEILVTGHYARIEKNSQGRWLLKKALHREKDQSYVLYMLTQKQMEKVRFPLGGMSKEEVRALAEEQGFFNAGKRDSQDICFVPDGDYPGFIRRFTGKQYPKGNFIDESGKVLGEHQGQIAYTLGQRRGLGVAGEKRLYVCGRNQQNNTILLGDNKRLFTRRFKARHVNLIACDRLDGPIHCCARIRYKQVEQPAVVTQTGPDELDVLFDEPQRAITPGQAVVLYDGDLVLGGGTIIETEGNK